LDVLETSQQVQLIYLNPSHIEKTIVKWTPSQGQYFL
jgi:hypothetical protein